jgi:hypothetical protein
MPVWGVLFKSLDPGSGEMVDLRLANLTRYIKAMQAK